MTKLQQQNQQNKATNNLKRVTNKATNKTSHLFNSAFIPLLILPQRTSLLTDDFLELELDDSILRT